MTVAAASAAAAAEGAEVETVAAKLVMTAPAANGAAEAGLVMAAAEAVAAAQSMVAAAVEGAVVAETWQVAYLKLSQSEIVAEIMEAEIMEGRVAAPSADAMEIQVHDAAEKLVICLSGAVGAVAGVEAADMMTRGRHPPSPACPCRSRRFSHPRGPRPPGPRALERGVLQWREPPQEASVEEAVAGGLEAVSPGLPPPSAPGKAAAAAEPDPVTGQRLAKMREVARQQSGRHPCARMWADWQYWQQRQMTSLNRSLTAEVAAEWTAGQ
jgi:hypothetical protein